MQPLINLKQFMAMLLLLVIPTALLVAYFRKYDPQAGGHQHSESATHGKGRVTTGKAENQTVPEQKASQLEALREQYEASRMQFEASRTQLDASRKALEALTAGDQPEKRPETPQAGETVPMQEERSDGHAHEHGKH
jgi:hypothetical protein